MFTFAEGYLWPCLSSKTMAQEVDVLKKIGFKGGIADPCLMMWQNNFGVNLMSIYVDDNICVGEKYVLKKLVEDLEREGLSV